MQVDLSRFSLAGKRALVTGASRGIGQAIAIGLAQAGASVAVSARTEAGLAETMAGLSGKGVAIAMDVADVAACRAGVEVAARALGGLDILINNAGMEEVRPSLDVDEKLWDRILDTNLKGAFFCAQAAASIMIEAGGGLPPSDATVERATDGVRNVLRLLGTVQEPVAETPNPRVLHGFMASNGPMNISYSRTASAPNRSIISSGLTTLPRDLDIF